MSLKQVCSSTSVALRHSRPQSPTKPGVSASRRPPAASVKSFIGQTTTMPSSICATWPRPFTGRDGARPPVGTGPKAELDAGRLRDLVAALRTHADTPEARQCIQYIVGNRHRMRYPQFRARGPVRFFGRRGRVQTDQRTGSSAPACAGPSLAPTPSSPCAVAFSAAASRTFGSDGPPMPPDAQITMMSCTRLPLLFCAFCARSLRRRTFAARNGSPAHALSSVSGRLRQSAGQGGFSVVGEQRAKFGPHEPPETAVRVDLPPIRAAFPASYAAISTCRRLTFNARHTKSHSHRTFASPRRLKRRKPSTCLIQP